MKKVLRERQYRIDLSAPGLQKKYLWGLIAQLNNEAIDPANTPGERKCAYQSIIQAMKVLSDVEKVETLQSLDERLKIVEQRENRYVTKKI